MDLVPVVVVVVLEDTVGTHDPLSTPVRHTPGDQILSLQPRILAKEAQ